MADSVSGLRQGRWPGWGRWVLVNLLLPVTQAITQMSSFKRMTVSWTRPPALHSGLGIVVVHVQILTVAMDQGNIGVLHIGVALKSGKYPSTYS